MNHESFTKAVDEAKEFVRRAAKVNWATAGAHRYVTGFRESASLKRQSMELTRALAQLRKP